MTINNEICTKYEIRKKSEFYFLLNSIRRDSENYNKKENNKRK